MPRVPSSFRGAGAQLEPAAVVPRLQERGSRTSPIGDFHELRGTNEIAGPQGAEGAAAQAPGRAARGIPEDAQGTPRARESLNRPILIWKRLGQSLPVTNKRSPASS